MSRILIADTPEDVVTLRRILLGHDCTVVSTMNEAKTQLNAQAFDLIIVALHFDGSQMFELIRAVRRIPKNADDPIICFCSRDTRMSRLMHESLECSTKVLGAWMYLDEHSYNVYQNPNAELRRVIERCLTEESRKEIQAQRLDLQRQRVELQQLRTLLQAQEWSPEKKEYLAGLKHDLKLLLKEVTKLHWDVDAQRASVKASRELRDRVAEDVRMKENSMTSVEESLSVAETEQSADEEKQAAKEEIKEAVAQRKQREKLEKGLKDS